MLESARNDGNYSPLIDLWAFNYWTYADTVRFIKDVQREVDPKARLGASTPLWNFAFRGYYWEKISPILDFFTPYYGGDGRRPVQRGFGDLLCEAGRHVQRARRLLHQQFAQSGILHRVSAHASC